MHWWRPWSKINPMPSDIVRLLVCRTRTLSDAKVIVRTWIIIQRTKMKVTLRSTFVQANLFLIHALFSASCYTKLLWYAGWILPDVLQVAVVLNLSIVYWMDPAWLANVWLFVVRQCCRMRIIVRSRSQLRITRSRVVLQVYNSDLLLY